MEFEYLSEEEKQAYEMLAQQDLVLSCTLWDELKTFLLNTKGKVPYEVMVVHLGSIVLKSTVVNILKKQEGYHMCKDRILQSLDAQAKSRQVT